MLAEITPMYLALHPGIARSICIAHDSARVKTT